MPQSAYPVNDTWTAIAIAYANREAIADMVLPRTDPLGTEEFKYTRYSLAHGFTVPETRVGRRSKPNQVLFDGEEVNDSTEDHGLDHPMPNKDIDNAPPGVDPMGRATEWISKLIVLGREVRTAGLVFNSASYAVNNTQALAAGDRFTDAASTPLNIMLDALDAPIMRPNKITFGQTEWRAFRTHPQIVSAVQRNSGTSGAVKREDVADLLEVDQILVGRSLVNLSTPGQTPNLQPDWTGGFVSLTYSDEVDARAKGAVYGFTAQYGQRVAGAKPDDDIGLRGGQRLRVGESVKEVISAPDLGYLLETVI